LVDTLVCMVRRSYHTKTSTAAPTKSGASPVTSFDASDLYIWRLDTALAYWSYLFSKVASTNSIENSRERSSSRSTKTSSNNGAHRVNRTTWARNLAFSFAETTYYERPKV
jgi:hypothetical protein